MPSDESVPILLATINAQYIHASLGLRYLLANLGELRRHAKLVEFTLEDRPIDVSMTCVEAYLLNS